MRYVEDNRVASKIKLKLVKRKFCFSKKQNDWALQ